MIEFIKITNTRDLITVPTEVKANWIHLEKPSFEEITNLSNKYNFPLDYLTAVLDNQEISRFESSKENSLDTPVLMLLQYPKQIVSPSGFAQFEALPFSIIMTKDMIITSCNDHLDFISALENSRKFDATLPNPERVAIQLSWYFSDLFNTHIKSIKFETERLESEIQSSTENKQLFELMDMQKSLVYFNAALEQNLSVFQKVHDANWLMKTPQSQTALFDIMIENKQAIASGKIQSELLSQLGAMFSAIVGNNMNIVMKVLTVITISLTIPTLIGGIYGMNVALPFQNEGNAFWWIMFLTFFLILLTVWLLKKNKFF
ncbi:magnesium transporter CorA family protein [Vagococcus coleopterorum]|uniref:Magnesium transporter CorA family protein n=1 Tax=Vagococcus coleopterorum TaxID=2714946 RepID=A0A6G8AKK3_9ENTE|nr:magnesium transporter CorA family protein [Vagococcus coleopterorum]QIL45588.1 magnesium transporter CorA family protein [Vagococcus coleopterorum]